MIARGDARARAREAPRDRAGRASQVDTAHQGYLEPQVGGGAGRCQRLRHRVGLHPGPVHRRADDRRACSACRSRSSRSCRSRSAAASAARSPSTARPWRCAWRRSAGRPVKLVLSREEVLQGGSGPAAAALIDIAVGADEDGRLVAIDGHLSPGCRRVAGPQPVAGDAGFGRALPVPQPRPAGLRRRHQQAAHRGLSRARRHPGGLRHGAGDGHAVPAARHGPAGVPQAQRLRHRQHHADRHAVSLDRPHHHPRARAASTPAGPIRCPRAACRAAAAWRSATGAARR